MTGASDVEDGADTDSPPAEPPLVEKTGPVARTPVAAKSDRIKQPLPRHQVSIQPEWTLSDAVGKVLPPRLVPLLQVVHREGTLLAACRSAALSYRHAWQLVKQGEEVLGTPLLVRSRGEGSRLTPVAEKLLWVESQLDLQLSAALRELESELEEDIGSAPMPATTGLRLHASHGPVTAALREALAASGVDLWYRDCDPVEAIASLQAGRCDVACLFVPEQGFEDCATALLKADSAGRVWRALPIAIRLPGLLVASGNPRGISGWGDLSRAGVRFAGRQVGSEPRLLGDWLLARAGIDPLSIAGYDHAESTQSGVAAAIARGRADAGIGVESLARQAGLEFLPIEREYGLLLWDHAAAKHPSIRELIRTVQESAFRARIERLEDHRAVAESQPIRLRPGSVRTVGRARERSPSSPDKLPESEDRPASPESALTNLLSRRSVSPKRLRHPGPNPEQIDWMLQAALRAPDHGGLCPWRVIEFRDAQRAALADCFESEKLRRDPLATAADLRRAREHAIRPPTLLAFVVSPKGRSKVPVREQSLGAGAALGNLLNAAHQLGFGGIVLSGERCFDPPLLTRLGIGDDEFLAGFISLGSIAEPPPPVHDIVSTRVWSCWNPDA